MLASITLRPDPQEFPVGTVCGIYRAADARPGAAPARATVAANATVAADGTLPVVGAPDATPLVAYALVGGSHRYWRFLIPPVDPSTFSDPGGFAGALVAPAGAVNAPGAGTCAHSAGAMRGVRVTVPKSGILDDFHEHVAAIGTGCNLQAAVYDTGEALAGSYTRLWLGAVVAAATGWRKLGDPGLEVVAGQELVLAVGFSTAQGSALGQAIAATASVLPAGFDLRGLSRKQAMFAVAAGGTPPAVVTNANFFTESSLPTFIARVR